MFQVTVSNRARRAIKDLPKEYAERTLRLLVLLQENPVPSDQHDVKKLRGLRDTYRVRLGEIRVVYQVLWGTKAVHVFTISRREAAY